MAIPWIAIPEGTRVRIKQGPFPQQQALLGKTGTVVMASEYQTQSLSVVLDGTKQVYQFAPEELEVTQQPALPPEREAAKQKRALP